MSSGVGLTLVGMVTLKDKASTSSEVAFTLALVVMWAEKVAHRIVPRPLLSIVFGFVLLAVQMKNAPRNSGEGCWEAVLVALGGLKCLVDNPIHPLIHGDRREGPGRTTALDSSLDWTLAG